jgi:hypothetical protein
MKPSIFIGSSYKSLNVAKEIQKQLKNDFEIIVWDSVFKPGDFFLDTLLKELYFADFGLFILFPDDRIEKKGVKGYTTRDNVIFELGMHIGALGTKRANFLVIEANKNGKELKLEIPSDLEGIKKIRTKLEINEDYSFKKSLVNNKAIKATCATLKYIFLESFESIALTLLPSTSLALGYFKNFILPACIELSQTTDFKVGDTNYDLTLDIFDFHIIIPENGLKSSHEVYQKFVKRNNLSQIEIKSRTGPRTFPFFISSNVINGRIQLFDLPTTLRSSWETIKLVMPTNSTKKEIERIEKKEIQNFRKTIEYFLQENESTEFRDNIHIVNLSEII